MFKVVSQMYLSIKKRFTLLSIAQVWRFSVTSELLSRTLGENMQLTSFTDYALRTLIFLASLPEDELTN
ncbi:hypothetical protein ACYTR9_23070, partial [Vibrio antiquarius]